jgi:haloalkane dehalogenase
MFAAMRILRTPEERFSELSEFAYHPEYCEIDDDEGGLLRVAWVEHGPAHADPVLMLHGEPSWSFLYRRMIPIVAAAGYRVVCPDLVGFGRSDKPAAIADHTYARHVEWMRALAFDVLDLNRVTLVGQDWGGLIGLRLAAEHPERFARIVVSNTGLHTGDLPMADIWWEFRKAIQGTRVVTPDSPLPVVTTAVPIVRAPVVVWRAAATSNLRRRRGRPAPRRSGRRAWCENVQR